MNDPYESGEEDALALNPAEGEKARRFLARVSNLWGTPRRFFLTKLRPDYVERSLAMRRGECNRCGLCCQLVVKCVFLRYENGLASCACYGKHPPNCSKFPINQSDIDDVNAIAPHSPCSYSFAPSSSSKS